MAGRSGGKCEDRKGVGEGGQVNKGGGFGVCVGP